MSTGLSTWKSCGLLDRGFLDELLLLFSPWTWCPGGFLGRVGCSGIEGTEGPEDGSSSSPVTIRSSVSSSPAVSRRNGAQGLRQGLIVETHSLVAKVSALFPAQIPRRHPSLSPSRSNPPNWDSVRALEPWPCSLWKLQCLKTVGCICGAVSPSLRVQHLALQGLHLSRGFRVLLSSYG